MNNVIDTAKSRLRWPILKAVTYWTLKWIAVWFYTNDYLNDVSKLLIYDVAEYKS